MLKKVKSDLRINSLIKKTWSAVLGGAIGGAGIGGALGNITSSPGAIKSMLPGIVSGGLSSAFSGSNFLSGAIGGIGYTSTIFDNMITSTDRMIDSGYSNVGENFENTFYSITYPSNLENEIWQAGLNPYDRDVFGRSDELMQKVGSIKKLANAITSRKGVLEVIDVFKLEAAGKTDLTNFRISLNVNTVNNFNLLGYGYTLSHELIHAFDLQFNMENWMRNYGSNANRGNDLQAWREKRSYDYNMRQGMKLEGAQIEFYKKTIETIKKSKGLQNNLQYFKTIDPWK